MHLCSVTGEVPLSEGILAHNPTSTIASLNIIISCLIELPERYLSTESVFIGRKSPLMYSIMKFGQD